MVVASLLSLTLRLTFQRKGLSETQLKFTRNQQKDREDSHVNYSNTGQGTSYLFVITQRSGFLWLLRCFYLRGASLCRRNTRFGITSRSYLLSRLLCQFSLGRIYFLRSTSSSSRWFGLHRAFLFLLVHSTTSFLIQTTVDSIAVKLLRLIIILLLWFILPIRNILNKACKNN